MKSGDKARCCSLVPRASARDPPMFGKDEGCSALRGADRSIGSERDVSEGEGEGGRVIVSDRDALPFVLMISIRIIASF